MGVAERKQREKEERRKLICEKARELILERGIYGFSMQDVANATELSKSTLYLYFENKEAILFAILAEAAESFVSFVQSRITPQMTGIQALHALWKAYIELFGKFQDVFVFTGIMNVLDPSFPFFIDANTSENELPHYKLYSLITTTLRKGITDGTLRQNIQAERVAKNVMLIGSAIIELATRLPRSQRNETIIIQEMSGIFSIMLRGLAAPGTAEQLLTLM